MPNLLMGRRAPAVVVATANPIVSVGLVASAGVSALVARVSTQRSCDPEGPIRRTSRRHRICL
jgi:hypothetical protein